MKKSVFILVACLFTLQSYAQTANAILFTENGEKFTAILNGMRQNDKPETNVKITGLNAEFFKLKVIFDNRSLGEKNFNLSLESGTETTYSIRKNSKGEYVLRIVSSVPVAQAATSAPSQSEVVYNDNPAGNPVSGGMVVEETTTTTTTRGSSDPDNVNFNMGMSVGESGGNISINVSGMDSENSSSVSHSTTTTTTTTVKGGSNPPPANDPVYLPGYRGAIGCSSPVSPDRFEALKQSIKSKSFEDTKMTIAKQVVGNQCLFVSQVKEIMGMFSFEESKLDFAKYAYKYTYDLGNYFMVNDSFTFESSIEELNQYIRSR